MVSHEVFIILESQTLLVRIIVPRRVPQGTVIWPHNFCPNSVLGHKMRLYLKRLAKTTRYVKLSVDCFRGVNFPFIS